MRQRIKIGAFCAAQTVQQARDTATKHAGLVTEGIDIQKNKVIEKQKAVEAEKNTLEAFMDDHFKPWVIVN